MICPMPRPRPPFLHQYRTRHGKLVWYVRRGGRKVRIREAFGTPEFDAAYRAALAGEAKPAPKAARVGALSWLYDRYREAAHWQKLSPATRRQRENIFVHVMAQGGLEPFNGVTKEDIECAAEARAHTPSQARNFLDAMRGLFRWAKKAGHAKDDPTEGVANPARPRNDGFPVWTEADLERYEACWPIGTKERVWLDVLLYTGLRRGDAVKIGRQHVRDGVATLRTEKSAGTVTVTIPILPILAATLKAGPCADLAFICGCTGKPLKKESFGNMFASAARAAGVGKSAHGIRKAGATRAAENGATVAELEAIFGWRGGGMASLYTRAADRVRLSKQAMTKLQRTPEQPSIGSPEMSSGSPGKSGKSVNGLDG